MRSDINQKADTLRKRANERYESIRRLKGYTPAGINGKLSQEMNAVQDKLTELDQQETESLNARRAQAERKLHGIGSTDPAAILLYRQGLADAKTAKTPAEALRKLEQARLIGDPFTERAIAADAAERTIGGVLPEGWQSVLDHYVENKPGEREALETLREIDTERGNSEARMNRAALFKAPVPRELHGTTDAQRARFAAMAEQDDAALQQPSDAQVKGQHLSKFVTTTVE